MIDLAHKSQTPDMFNRIALRYDILNTILSFGMHGAWRKAVARQLPHGDDLHVLDLATGTGDQLITLFKTGKLKSAIGLDPSFAMVRIAEQKCAKQLPYADVTFVEADAARIPFENEAFDAVTMSFGIRNVPNVVDVLKEAYRVLQPGGRLLILEFSTPTFGMVRALHTLYLRTVVAWLGGLLSGDRAAYKYLNKSIEAFPSGDVFCDLMHYAGFENVSFEPLFFGAVSVYNGGKAHV